MGLKKENIIVNDRFGVIYKGRIEEMNPYNSAYAIDTTARTLDNIIEGADVFLGVSAPRVLTQQHVLKMAQNPLILALANPEPEILPELAKAARSDAIIATGRSDYPNQVNNVLCFPFLFRGALDVGATEINDAMKLAAVKAIADLTANNNERQFGRDYFIADPFDPRLLLDIPPRVAQAAMESGVATHHIDDFDAYHERLKSYLS
jgi:malate dehydrogenase (oxaloacetate-decarboxylating)(NADP+)